MKIKDKYCRLDALLMEAIGTSPITFASLLTGDIGEECDRVALTNAFGNREPDRVLDRRLQALRKSWRIYHTGKGWVKR